jgi:hypothetical protein
MPLQLVIDNTHRRVTECDLAMRQGERDAYRVMAEIGRPFGFLDAKAEQRAAEPLPEMACAAPSAPSVPTRRNRRLPTLPWWRRLLMRWLSR